MQKYNWKDLTPQQALKVTHILFFGGLGLMLLGLMIGGVANHAALIAVPGVLGVCSAIVGIIFGHLHVRCPDCGGSLMTGGKVPGSLSKFCPHCGKQL